MPTEFSSRGDPRRSMELLWGAVQYPTRGPKPGLTVQQIVAAAIEIADADGLPGLTMRHVADRLGIGAMSIYTYVPGKAELLDLMLDTVYREALLPDQPSEDWRPGLERRARADWRLYELHPWMLSISGSRSVLGPNEIALFEQTTRVLSGTGLTPRETVAVVSLVAGYVRGAAQGAHEATIAEAATGVSDAEWWEGRASVMDEFIDPAELPTITSLYEQGAFDQPDTGRPYILQRMLDDFEFGLQRVLDGIEAFIQRR